MPLKTAHCNFVDMPQPELGSEVASFASSHLCASSTEVQFAVNAFVDGPLRTSPADLTVPLYQCAIGLDQLEVVGALYNHLERKAANGLCSRRIARSDGHVKVVAISG